MSVARRQLRQKMRIKGIGGEYAELLEAAGVDTVRELKHRNPANLAPTWPPITSRQFRSTAMDGLTNHLNCLAIASDEHYNGSRHIAN